MAAPAMVNTSAFNTTITRVQIIKSQLPLADIPSDTGYIDIRNDKVYNLARYILCVSISYGRVDACGCKVSEIEPYSSVLRVC